MIIFQAEEADQRNYILVLQESFFDPTGSFVVYAPLDVVNEQELFEDECAENLPVLPAGFSIFPDGTSGSVVTGGSLLTAAFQVLVNPNPTGFVSVSSISSVGQLLLTTIEKIKAHLPSGSA